MKSPIPSPLVPLTCTLILASTVTAAEPVGLLVTSDQLASRLDDSGTVVLDVRSQDDYDEGHIPHALHVDLNAWKQHSLTPGGLVDRKYWAEQVGNLGITRDRSVVVYGGNPTDATRLWWTLEYLGVTHVGVLDGGFQAWTAAGGPVSQNAAEPVPVEFEPAFQSDRLADITEVQSLLKTNGATIIDTRSDAEYTGSGGPGPRHGHIPGAVHQEWKEFVNGDGRFKPVAEIKALLKEHGLTPDTKAVTHCQTGGRASLNAFAMELAGYGPIKNYYCGWSEWSTTEDAPIEAEAAPIE